jgi:ABC-2 type transport system ATP-binding protein
LGEPEKLLKQHYNSLIIQLARADVGLQLDRIPGKVFEREDHLEIQTDRIDATFKALIEAGTPLTSLRVRQRDLEDLFLDITGKALRT